MRVGKQLLVLGVMLLALIGGMLVISPATAVSADKIILKVATRFPPPPSDASRFLVHWLDGVKERSKGRIDFQYYWGGSMVSAPEELSMLGKGVFDIGVISYLAQPGLTPLGTVDWAVPFGTVNGARSLAAKRKLYQEIPAVMKELTDRNVLPLSWFPMKQFWLYTKVPISSLDDLKGKKIGASGKSLTLYMKATGATTVGNLVGEKYEMLKTGVTDGELMDFFFMTDYKIYEVVKYAYKLNLARVIPHPYAVNMDTWKRLPEDIKKIMVEEALATEKWELDMEATWFAENQKKWEAAGVKFSTFPAAEEAKWANLLKDTPQTWADEQESKGLPGKKVMSLYIETLEKLGEKMPIKYTIK
jgi:TRAP-type transport system periplasmic protein